MLPCDELKVIEIGSYIAVPCASALLADMGATVIKIEPPGGDPLRQMFPDTRGINGSFDVVNRGKQSVTMDLHSGSDRERLYRLISDADVFMCSLLPAKQEKLGVNPDVLLYENSMLVHASLTGFGSSGPDANKPGFDTTAFFSRSGLADRLRDSEENPPPWPAPAQGDYTAGMSMAMAVLAALLLRDKVGSGQVIETSLLETAIWTQSLDYGPRLIDRADNIRKDRYQVPAPTSNRYRCGDGRWLMLTMPMPGAWKRLCAALDRLAWLDDDRFRTPDARVDNMKTLIKMIDAVLAGEPLAFWAKRFDTNGLVWAPVMSQREVLDCPQTAALEMFPGLTHPEHGNYQTVRSPFRLRGKAMVPRTGSPELGQHNDC